MLDVYRVEVLLWWALPVFSFGLALIATITILFFSFVFMLSDFAATETIKKVKIQLLASMGVSRKITNIRELDSEQYEFFFRKFEGYYSPEKVNVRLANLYYSLSSNLQKSVSWLSAICTLFLAWEQVTNYTSSIAFVYVWYVPLAICISMLACYAIAKWCLLTTGMHVAEVKCAYLVALLRNSVELNPEPTI
ncbi:ABC transmembrane type-1 domain-containing protein [Vibrio crassostreae]|uniref:hypothetical protein n=1 Tax=Vibrio crassostreae TaxID=246167 RepID=UPI0005E810C7|nr:hypothetical protein [Vibrio crassostreae]TDW03011.1 hypothetical protein EDB45_12830 [Vibrio crassostreae]CAK1950215.1 ABC transmembrane type-1 domain-containing protein [Vibrio crassostreae]CAK1950233.1 ABC transmembrane type-1 domain-containing protein [Vibrio crassostreae]CAK1954685.1 ABC transmembrane type-1 domain-containing protein [Vibrio crassostreae]CAK2027822.1 ABC transmembrane type-1 domain-containing protein [Vibrio crassostreae]